MKKLGLWFASICLIVCSAFAAVGCDGFGANKGESNAVQQYVELSETSISLEVYMQHTLTVTTNVDEDVVWTTSDPTVATVEDGVVSALLEGVATITASAGNAKATCVVTVNHLSGFPDLTVSSSSLELVEGGNSITVEAAVLYKGVAQQCTFTWVSANPSVATVENGTIMPVGVGETTITVTTVCMNEILTKDIHVVVNVDEQILVSKGAINLTLVQVNSYDLTVDTFTAEAYLKGVANKNATLTYETSDPAVATVSVNGKEATVTAVGLGNCVVSVWYDSENGKIQSNVQVNVSRAEVVVDGITEMTYISAGTKLDLSLFELLGEFQGVYYMGECVSALDGTFTKDFATANNHGFAIDVELRTDVAVYYTQIAISIEHSTMAVIGGESAKEVVAYDGDVTALGFDEGASVTQYKHIEGEGWENRLLPKDLARIRSFDHWIVEFSLSEEATASAVGSPGVLMTVWVGQTHLVLVSVNKLQLMIYDPSGTDDYEGSDSEHNADPCVSIYNAEGKIPSHLEANTKYYFEMHIEHAGKGDMFAFAFNDALDVYIADSYFCTDVYYDANIAPTRDNTPPEAYVPAPKYPVVCGDERVEMPKYDGDATTLGFAEDTVVYEFENASDYVWDDAWYKRAIIFMNKKQDFVRFEFVTDFDVATGNVFSAWGEFGVPHIGSISCNGVTGNWAVITDMDGNIVENGIQKDTHYVLTIACAGLSEIQVGSIVNGVVYFGNITFGNGSILPNVSDSAVIDCYDKVLPLYKGDVTELGFAEGTEVYEHVQDNRTNMWAEGTTLGLTMEKQTIKLPKTASDDYASIQFSLSRELTGKYAFFSWWYNQDGILQSTTIGYLTTDGEGYAITSGYKVVAYDMDGNVATSFKAKTVYELRWYGAGDMTFKFGCCEQNGESITLYYANPSSGSDEGGDTPVVPADPSISQGDDRKPMPTYSGDVTSLGFPAGTDPVYVITGGSAAWDNRIVMQADATKDYLKFDVVFSTNISHLTMWPANAEGTHGSYSVTPNGSSTVDAIADRIIRVVDKFGNTPEAFVAGEVYTVYFYLIEETEVQMSCFLDATVYVANIKSGNGEVTPDTPVVPADPSVSQGDDRKPMPTYSGDVTSLGFPAGTDPVYVITGGSAAWDNRIVMQADATKDYLKFDVVFSTNISYLTMWPANAEGTHGSYSVMPNGSSTLDAIADRIILVVDKFGNTPEAFVAGEVYTVYFYLIEETEVQMSCFQETTVYVANIKSGNGEIIPDTPVVPADPSISQGEGRNPMPTYSGDVTSLGFAEGTVVYQVVGPQSNASDVKLVATIDSTGNVTYAKADIVFSKATTSFGLWITAENKHLGYYTVTPTSFTPDGNGDASRTIFVTDKDGNKVTSFQANTIYTLYVGLDGREVTIQITTWADLTMYVANVACITDAQAPSTPNPPVQGKDISILFIGNSFSDDTEAYMVDILLDLGYTNINIGNLYIGGCSIDTHYSNIRSDAKAYEFRMRSHNGKKYTEYEATSVGGEKQSMSFALAYKNWDIISVQQASGESGKADSYKNLDDLVAEVKKQATNANVEIVFNMTWAYQGNSTHAQFPDYNSNQMTMYTAIVNAVQEEVVYTVVPNATSIQNARTSMLGDTLTRDGYHLDLQIGRFIAGLTFVAKVTGVDISELTYAPAGINDTQFAIAIESVQNALAYPYTITESEIQEEIIENPDIVSGGSNTTAVTVYKGDVTALGFAAGSTVYKYVGVDSSSDKASIMVDSSKYDYVEVQLVIAEGDGYFFMHGLKGGNYHNNGISYVVDPGWIRLGDGKNSPSDRVIEVYDANGNKVSSLMSKNVLYTLRVYIKVGELDEISISKANETIYFANVKQGVASSLPVEGPIKQGETSVALPNYNGDATALGFEAGEYLQYMETETVANVWGDKGPTSGMTREQLAAKIFGESGKYVTVKFATSEDIASGSVFYVWGLLSGSHTQNGGVSFTNNACGRILDVNGNAVTSITKNTVYVLELYLAGTDTYKVANICTTGMKVYFAANSITCSATPMEAGKPNNEQPAVTAGGSNTEAVSKYDGDVTALGFAAGTTVYKFVGTHDSNDRASIKADSSYDYVEVQFVITEGAGYFIMHGLKGGVWHNKGTSYIVDPSNIRLNDGNNTPSDRVIEIYDANGNKVTTLMENNVVYTLRVYVKVGELDEIRISKKGSTIYFANVTYGNDD